MKPTKKQRAQRRCQLTGTPRKTASAMPLARPAEIAQRTRVPAPATEDTRRAPSQSVSTPQAGGTTRHPPPRGETGMPPLPTGPPSRLRHTIVAVTRRGRWKRETTPPLGLRHLTDDLERSRGTTKDRATHTHTPGGACGAAAARPTPPRGGPLARRGREATRSVHCVTKTSAPPTPQGRGRESEVGPGSAPLPSTHHRRAGRRGEGPVGRARRAGPFDTNARPSPGTA